MFDFVVTYSDETQTSRLYVNGLMYEVEFHDGCYGAFMTRTTAFEIQKRNGQNWPFK